MAELIPTGTAEANSLDFTVAAGTETLLFLKNATGAPVGNFCRADVQASSGALYFTIGTLSGDSPARVLGPGGPYRVVRRAAADAFGVDRF